MGESQRFRRKKDPEKRTLTIVFGLRGRDRGTVSEAEKSEATMVRKECWIGEGNGLQIKKEPGSHLKQLKVTEQIKGGG